MICVVKKIFTKPFGGEIPPELAEALDELVNTRGWKKRRALAAAIRQFLLNPKSAPQAYQEAYEPLPRPLIAPAELPAQPPKTQSREPPIAKVVEAMAKYHPRKGPPSQEDKEVG